MSVSFSEARKFAIYQMQESYTTAHEAGPSSRLMQVALGDDEVDNGIYSMQDISLVGTARQVEAIFESHTLLFTRASEARDVIVQAAHSLSLEPREVASTLGSEMIVVYSFSGE